MGDRSNVYIQTERNEADGEWDGIGLYSHWGGTAFQDDAIKAMASSEARNRVGDPAYYARVIAATVIGDISGMWLSDPCDNEHSILVINALTGDHHFLPWDFDGTRPWRKTLAVAA